MRRMLGAPLGGTTRGGHHGVESLALSLITPPNGIGGGGSCFPSSVTVALGEPGTPVICWAKAGVEPSSPMAINRANTVKVANVFWHRAFIERCPPPSKRFEKKVFSEPTMSKARTVDRAPWLRSRDHAAFKHLVGDRRRDPIDEHLAHLRITAQKIYGFLFPLRFRLPALLPQLLARGILVLLDDLVGGLVQQRVLGAAYARE